MGEIELKQDVRNQTGYTDRATLSRDALDTAYRNAQRHIRVRKGLETNFDWFDSSDEARYDALYWWTCLFVKMATGELDAQDLQIGAIDQKALLAKDDDEVTQWYRNAESAIRAIQTDGVSTVMQSASPTRDDRVYGSDDGTSTDISGGGG